MAFILVLLELQLLLGNLATAAPSIPDQRHVPGDVDATVVDLSAKEELAGWMRFPQTGEDFMEGDIKIPEQFRHFHSGQLGGPFEAAVNFNSYPTQQWPGNTVAYTISPVFSNDERRRIMDAIREFESRTCLKFVQRTTQRDYINIKKGNGCWSSVGHIGGPQDLSLGQGCLYDRGTPIHELMHAIGFFHEQSRPDRDDFVTIHWDEIHPNSRHNFNKMNPDHWDSLGSPYDWRSVMHYQGNAFAIGRRPTITSKPPGITIGQRNGFSEQDLVQINKLYGCSTRMNEANQSHKGPIQTPPNSTAESGDNRSYKSHTIPTVTVMKSAQCGRGGGGGRIVGGREVQRGEHPSIVSLKFGGGHICGGTLISEEWVLTAAHCVNDYRARTISVTIREHNVLEPEYPIDAYTVKPSKIIVHEHYADEGMNVTQANDIALIKLSSPIRLEGDEFAAAACLPDEDSETFTGQNASAVGWGRAAEDPNETPPPILQQVILPVISNQECSSLLAGIFKIGRGQMCAGFREGGKDACQGDSGGPLYVRKGRIDYLVGITSFGEGCARPDLPGVYARTSYYLNWIRHNMNTN